MTITATPVPERRATRVAWQVHDPGAGETPTAFDVSVGLGGYWLHLGERPRPHVHLPGAHFGHSIEVELGLRVTARVGDVEVHRIDTTVTLPPAFDVPASRRWELSPFEVVADDRQRRDAGLDMGVDGTFGLATITGTGGPTTVGFAPNGPRLVRWRVDGEQLLGSPVQEVELDARHDGVEVPHASGGPVLHDPTSGMLLLVYHGELWTGGDPLAFWSYLGLARSDDAGRSWTDLGPIIEPEIRPESDRRAVLVEVGAGPYAIVPVDGVDHMVVYFRDTTAEQVPVNVAAAAAPLHDVLVDAHAGRAPAFRKWTGAGFAAPGRGGRSVDLVPDGPLLRWFDVVSLVDHNQLVLVGTDGVGIDWTCLLTTSDDGIVWSPLERLATNRRDGERLYLTLAAPGGADQRRVPGDTVEVFQTRSPRPYPRRWEDARIERARLRRRP